MELKDCKGKILATFVHYNFSMDTEEYSASVWNDVTRNIETIYCKRDTIPDASLETLRKARKYYTTDLTFQLEGKAISESRKPYKDRIVKVISGRKHLGKEGKVFWYGPDRYNPGNFAVGFKTNSNEVVWISAWNVDVINPERIDVDKIKVEAAKKVKTYYILRRLYEKESK
jgi:hypothetical protein